MSDFSNYLENLIINHFLRNQAYTPVGTLYLALFTADTGLETDNPSAEVSGGSYARQAITLAEASGGASTNSGDITFPQASGNWGTVTHAALVDHATNVTWGTNVHVMMWHALTASKPVDTGDTLKFSAGDVDVSVA